MINSKKINLGGQDVTVTEVKVKRMMVLLPFLNDAPTEGEVEKGFMENLDELLQESCGLTRADLEELHGSELEQLWDAFREVNGFFFKTLTKLGVAEKIPELLGTLLSAYGGMFASLLSGVTPTLENMDLAGLPEQLKPAQALEKTG